MAIPRRVTEERRYVWQGDPAVGGGAALVPHEPGKHEGADVFVLRPMNNGEVYDVAAEAELPLGPDGKIATGTSPALLYRHCLAVGAMGCKRIECADGSVITDVRAALGDAYPRELTYAVSNAVNAITLPNEGEVNFRGGRPGAAGGDPGPIPAEV